MTDFLITDFECSPGQVARMIAEGLANLRIAGGIGFESYLSPAVLTVPDQWAEYVEEAARRAGLEIQRRPTRAGERGGS